MPRNSRYFKVRWDLFFVASMILVSASFGQIKDSTDRNDGMDLPRDDSSSERSIHEIRMSFIVNEEWREATIYERIKEDIVAAFYPKSNRSLISLFGYPLDYFQESCTQYDGEKKRPYLGIKLGRIVAIKDDLIGDKPTRVLQNETMKTLIRPRPKHLNQSMFTANLLCESLNSIIDKYDDLDMIAVERPIPTVLPNYRYLIQASTLDNTTETITIDLAR